MVKEGKIRIVIVDDDKELMGLLVKLFGSESDMEVIATYLSGNLFIDNFPSIQPDVVVMDIEMKGKNGIECIAEAKALKPAVQFLVSTAFENHDYIFKSLFIGASGYMLKSDRQEAMVEAVRDISNGGSPMSPHIARLVVNSFFKPVKATDQLNELTEKEREIIKYLADGFIYKEIGAKLFISPHTVRTHIRNIYEKLHVKSKTEAINKVFPRQ